MPAAVYAVEAENEQMTVQGVLGKPQSAGENGRSPAAGQTKKESAAVTGGAHENTASPSAAPGSAIPAAQPRRAAPAAPQVKNAAPAQNQPRAAAGAPAPQRAGSAGGQQTASAPVQNPQPGYQQAPAPAGQPQAPGQMQRPAQPPVQRPVYQTPVQPPQTAPQPGAPAAVQPQPQPQPQRQGQPPVQGQVQRPAPAQAQPAAQPGQFQRPSAQPAPGGYQRPPARQPGQYQTPQPMQVQPEQTAPRQAASYPPPQSGYVQQNPPAVQRIEDRMTPAEAAASAVRLHADDFRRVLPRSIDPDRYLAMLISLANRKVDLSECSAESFVNAALQAAQLGIEPDTALNQAYLVPYRDRRTGRMTVQFQLSYRGMIDLAYRSGCICAIDAKEVYEADEFSYEFGIAPKLRHIPHREGNCGPLKFVYAYYRTTNGGCCFEVMSRSELEQYCKQYCRGGSNGPWRSDFAAMAKKTVLKKVLKYAPLSTEARNAFAADQMVSVNAEYIPAAGEEVF